MRPGGPAGSARPGGLRRFVEPRPRQQPGHQTEDRCELCAAPLAERHAHVVNLQTRSLVCACQACRILFGRDGAATGTYRAVPDRYLYDPAFALTDAQWDELQIPVTMAFFFFNSTLGRVVAIYPSPAGAVESSLTLDA